MTTSQLPEWRSGSEISTDQRTRPRAPFFVVGAERSGTTMLRLMLNSHPNIVIPHETGFITVFARRLHEYGEISNPQNQRRLLTDISSYGYMKHGGLIRDTDEVLAYPITGYGDLVNAVFAAFATAKGKSRWGDKTPDYTVQIDILWNLFPGCRFIHLVRDGRDRALSMRSMSWGSRSIPRLAEDWRWQTTLAHKVGSVLGEYYLEVRYEELVQQPERTLRSICGFLHEPYDEAMLTYHLTADREVPSTSLQWHRSSIQAPDPAKIYRWKREMSLADRIIFQQVAGDALELFGYEREDHSSTLSSRVKNLYYATVRRW